MPSLVCKRTTASGNRISPPKVALKNKLLAGVQNMGKSRKFDKLNVLNLFFFLKVKVALKNKDLTGVQNMGKRRNVARIQSSKTI
jgi:hypothetical protein